MHGKRKARVLGATAPNARRRLGWQLGEDFPELRCRPMGRGLQRDGWEGPACTQAKGRSAWRMVSPAWVATL